MAALKQSTAYTRSFLLVQTADHITGLTGASPAVNISKAGAAFGAAAGAVTEIANGWYKVGLTTADTGTLGDLAYHITAASADPTDFVDQVTANILGDTLPANLTQVNAHSVTDTANGVLDVNAKNIGGTAQTGRDIGASVLLAAGQKVDVDTIKTNPVVNAGTVTFPTGATLASTTNITSGTITTTTNLTNLPAITANWLTATGIAASALNGKGDWPVGKTGYSITGTITTLDSLATHGDSDWATATGFATPTNITSGTITTVTNLTNAPTSGDFTATMKSSLNAATPTVTAGTVTDKTGYALTSAYDPAKTASQVGDAMTLSGDLTSTMKTSVTTAATAATPIAASVTGNIGGSIVGHLGGDVLGNVDGSVGSVAGSVTVGTNNDKTGYSLTQSFPANFASLGISAGGDISVVDTLTTYTGNTVQTGDSYARLGTPAGVSVSADIGALPTADNNATGVLDLAAGVETNMTVRQAMRLMLAALAGKLSGAATTTVSIRDTNDTKNRIVATVDPSGDRSAVSLDAS